MGKALPTALSGSTSAAAAASLLGIESGDHAAWVQSEIARRASEQPDHQLETPRDVLDLLLCPANGNIAVERPAVLPIVDDLLAAGADTTAAAVATSLLLLSNDLKRRGEAEAEAQSALASESELRR